MEAYVKYRGSGQDKAGAGTLRVEALIEVVMLDDGACRVPRWSWKDLLLIPAGSQRSLTVTLAIR